MSSQMPNLQLVMPDSSGASTPVADGNYMTPVSVPGVGDAQLQSAPVQQAHDDSAALDATIPNEAQHGFLQHLGKALASSGDDLSQHAGSGAVMQPAQSLQVVQPQMQSYQPQFSNLANVTR